jgi:hypothetical protein
VRKTSLTYPYIEHLASVIILSSQLVLEAARRDLVNLLLLDGLETGIYQGVDGLLMHRHLEHAGKGGCSLRMHPLDTFISKTEWR